MHYLYRHNHFIYSLQGMAGIYIHIPFCRTICHYCDFYKLASFTHERSFVDSLITEIEMRADYLRGEQVKTLYFGGGTPSAIEAAMVSRIFSKLKQVHHFHSECEITLEANPDDLTDDYLGSLRDQTPVNRLSIGIQSFNDHSLKLMNRRHTAQQALQCINLADRHGYTNISVDLIYGIPGTTKEDLKFTLDRLFALDIKHLSAYHLTFEPKTIFHKKLEKGLLTPLSEEESLAQFNYMVEEAGNHGYIHYEISNWAYEGYFSKHNTNYWKNKSYLGLGPSAHSYNGTSRQWNVSNIKQYIEGIQAGQPVYEMEVLTRTNRLNEYLLTTLRTMWGVDLKYLTLYFGAKASERLLKSGAKYIRSGHMKLSRDFLTLTHEGYFISDTIIGELMEPETRR
jgi:oxygen-independent coproporphyrinogen-3 oxidase